MFIYTDPRDLNLNLGTIHETNKSVHSTFDEVDMNIAAPGGLMDYFSTDDIHNSPMNGAGNGMQHPALSPKGSFNGMLSPRNKNGNKHFARQTRVSMFRAHSHHGSQLSSYGSGSIGISSFGYAKLKLLHRCVTLRTKAHNNGSKKSLVMDLANFGLFLKLQGITDKHKWFDKIWNKYDKLFKLKIDFYFVNELLTDLLNEYLMDEYDTNIEHIMSVDLKKAIQQIIIHIRQIGRAHV